MILIHSAYSHIIPNRFDRHVVYHHYPFFPIIA